MSHTGLGLSEEPLDKSTLGAGDLGSSRNHLGSFIQYTFNKKHLDLRYLHEPIPKFLI